MALIFINICNLYLIFIYYQNKIPNLFIINSDIGGGNEGFDCDCRHIHFLTIWC